MYISNIKKKVLFFLRVSSFLQPPRLTKPLLAGTRLMFVKWRKFLEEGRRKRKHPAITAYRLCTRCGEK